MLDVFCVPLGIGNCLIGIGILLERFYVILSEI